MRIAGSSDFFLSQRVRRWQMRWLFLSLPIAAAASIAALLLLWAATAVLGAAGADWAAEAAGSFDETSDDALSTTPSLLGAELFMLGALFWAAAIAGSLSHGRSIRSLIEPLTGFRWSIVRRVLAFELLALAVIHPWPLLGPGRDTLDFTGIGWAHLGWAIPMLLLVLIQTSGEDVFFKGYLLRQLGAATRLIWLAPILVIGTFVSLHIGNPDVTDTLWLILPLFVASDVIIVFLMMRTGGMEAPLVLHWTNNTMIVLFIAERATQANDLTLVVFDEDPSTLTDDYLGAGFYVLYLVAQVVAFTWRRSPFYLAPHGFAPQKDDSEASESDGVLLEAMLDD